MFFIVFGVTLFTVQIAGLFLEVHISAKKDVTAADTYNNFADNNYDYYDTYDSKTANTTDNLTKTKAATQTLHSALTDPLPAPTEAL